MVHLLNCFGEQLRGAAGAVRSAGQKKGASLVAIAEGRPRVGLVPVGRSLPQIRSAAGAAQIGVDCEQGCMGSGFRAKATIGRAVLVVVRNVLRSVQYPLDRGTFSTPGGSPVGAPDGKRPRPADRARPGALTLLHRVVMVQSRHPAGAVGRAEPARARIGRSGPPARPAGGHPARPAGGQANRPSRSCRRTLARP